MPSGSSGVVRVVRVVRGRQSRQSRQGSSESSESSGVVRVVRVVRGRQSVVRGRQGRQESSESSGVVSYESSESSGVVTQNSTTIETITVFFVLLKVILLFWALLKDLLGNIYIFVWGLLKQIQVSFVALSGQDLSLPWEPLWVKRSTRMSFSKMLDPVREKTLD